MQKCCFLQTSFKIIANQEHQTWSKQNLCNQVSWWELCEDLVVTPVDCIYRSCKHYCNSVPKSQGHPLVTDRWRHSACIFWFCLALTVSILIFWYIWFSSSKVNVNDSLLLIVDANTFPTPFSSTPFVNTCISILSQTGAVKSPHHMCSLKKTFTKDCDLNRNSAVKQNSCKIRTFYFQTKHTRTMYIIRVFFKWFTACFRIQVLVIKYVFVDLTKCSFKLLYKDNLYNHSNSLQANENIYKLKFLTKWKFELLHGTCSKNVNRENFTQLVIEW